MSYRRRLIRTVACLAGVLSAWSTNVLAADNYTVEFAGVPDGFGEKLNLISNLAAERRAYPTTAAIRRAAIDDIKAIGEALKAGGYYAAKIDYSLNRLDQSEVVDVVFTITPGPAFKISEYKIIYRDDGDADRPRSLAAVDVETEGRADGASLQRAQQDFLTALWNQGYPAAKITARRAEADMDAGTAIAVFEFNSGPRAKFGKIEFTGAIRTRPDFLSDLKTWKKGDLFERSKLVAFRDRLAATGLFGSVDVIPSAPDDDGAAPILVEIEERKRRTIGAGVSYSTSEGPGGRLFLEYRNMLGRGEKTRVEIGGSEIEQSITFDFDKPLPNLPGSVFAQFSFINETTDAFDARSIELSGGFAKKWLQDRLETRGGVGLETSKVRADGAEERTYFFSLPMSITWDTENSLLDPTKGARAGLQLTPYTGSDTFTQVEFKARSRIQFGSQNRFTAAFRTRLGATVGSSLADLPLNKRYFAGGGASIRGYNFQAAGPLDADGSPIGGRSVIEGAVEGRYLVTDRIQIAAFIDAGSVHPQSFPEFGGDYFVGAGAGVRYLTPVGPIRVDIATPLERRSVDRAVQFYISLGQPF